MSEKLHTALIAAGKEIRDLFNTRDVPHMTLDIKISGRVTGELKVSYEICEQYEAGVKGGNLDAIVEEFFRRRGWKDRNEPLAIPYVEDKSDNDDVVVHATIADEE